MQSCCCLLSCELSDEQLFVLKHERSLGSAAVHEIPNAGELALEFGDGHGSDSRNGGGWHLVHGVLSIKHSRLDTFIIPQNEIYAHFISRIIKPIDREICGDMNLDEVEALAVHASSRHEDVREIAADLISVQRDLLKSLFMLERS